MISSLHQKPKFDFLVVDEVSLMHALYHAHISNRIQEITPFENENIRLHHPVVMLGDYDQISGVGLSIPNAGIGMDVVEEKKKTDTIKHIVFLMHITLITKFI